MACTGGHDDGAFFCEADAPDRVGGGGHVPDVCSGTQVPDLLKSDHDAERMGKEMGGDLDVSI